MSLEDIFALPSTARVTTFFLSLASTNPPLSEQGRSFGFFLLCPSLDDLRKTLGGFGSHSLEIFLSELSFKPSPGWPAPAASAPVFQAFRCRAFHPVAVLACREVYQNHPKCQFFSSRFFKGTFHPVCHVTWQPKHYECFRLLSYSPKTTSFF